ncbi:MAG: tol-pal system protein YbgF [Gammaproteobacteria bacterium]|nr:tol-pal system protein YbgF [Gammaproteobacteria bacterium]
MANSDASYRYHRITLKSAVCGVVICVAAAHAADPATERRLSDIDNRVNQLEGVLGNKVLMEMLQRIDSLQRELQAARDATERTAYALEGLKDRQHELYLDIDQRLRALETAGPDSDPVPRADAPAIPPMNDRPADMAAVDGPRVDVTPPVNPVAEPEPPDETSAGADNGQGYRDAFELLKNGQYDESIDAFNRFITDYPQSIYASNAQYWLAEANYVSGNYERATAEFSQVIERYPDSAKVPDARLKLGFTYYELEQWAQARAVLDEVTRQHPNTTVARLAASRLQRMDREGN